MRKGAGEQHVAHVQPVAPPPGGAGRARTPKKNARKRLIIQEKISRELEAARGRTADGQASVQRCVNLAASLQEQLIDAAHSLKETLHASSAAPGLEARTPAVGDLVDQLCHVQLLHHAVHHSLELLQSAADKLIQTERAAHVLESNSFSSPGGEGTSKTAAASAPAVISKFGHLDAGAFFSAAAAAPMPASLPGESASYPVQMLTQHGQDALPSAAAVSSPGGGARPSFAAGRLSSCSTVTDVDTSRMSQQLPAALADHAARGEDDGDDLFSRSASAHIPSPWATSAPGPSPWLTSSLEPAPSAPSPSVWQMTDAEKLRAQRAMSRTRTVSASVYGVPGATDDSPLFSPDINAQQPPAPPPPQVASPTPAEALYERSLSAPLRHVPPAALAAAQRSGLADPGLSLDRMQSTEMMSAQSRPPASQQGPMATSVQLPLSDQVPTQQPPQVPNDVNAWLHGSSSEDESEDPRADNPASVMLNMLAPGVPPDILWCLSLSNPSSDASTLHARGSIGSMGAAAGVGAPVLGGAGVPGHPASPAAHVTRSRSDAETLLRTGVGGVAPGAVRMLHGSSSRAQVGKGQNPNPGHVTGHRTLELPSVDSAPAQRMPSEDYLAEVNSQARAVVSALHAAFSSLERVVLPAIRRAADDLRSQTPLLRQLPSAPAPLGRQLSAAGGLGGEPQQSWPAWPPPPATIQLPQSNRMHLPSISQFGPALSGGAFAQAGEWPGAHANTQQRVSQNPHPLSHQLSAPPLWGHGLCSSESAPFPGISGSATAVMPLQRSPSQSQAHSHAHSQSPLQHASRAPPAPTVPRQWRPFVSEFALASGSGFAPPVPPGSIGQQMPPPPSSAYPLHRMPSSDATHQRLSSMQSAGPFDGHQQRRPSDGGNSTFVEQLARACSASGAFEPAKRTYSAGGSFTGEPGALSAFGELTAAQAPAHSYTMVFPRCDVCAVRSNSAQSLTAHLESKGHQRKVMMQAVMLCEASISASPGTQSSSGGGGGGPGTAQKGGKEETSLTLMHYRKELPEVRVADEAMNKDVLALLFQLVQMQIRKAEKSRESLPRAHKRCLAGMKEVAWAVSKPGQAKLVLIAPNIQIPCPDSILLSQVRELVAKCREVDAPVIMGPSRKQLGMAFRTSEGSKSTFKLMSAVALLDISGAEPQWQSIMARFPSLPCASDLEDPPPADAPATPDRHQSPSNPPASAAGGAGHRASNSGGEKRGLVPAAAVVVERVLLASRDESPVTGARFQKILEGASALLGQIVSLGSRTSSSGARIL